MNSVMGGKLGISGLLSPWDLLCQYKSTGPHLPNQAFCPSCDRQCVRTPLYPQVRFHTPGVTAMIPKQQVREKLPETWCCFLVG